MPASTEGVDGACADQRFSFATVFRRVLYLFGRSRRPVLAWSAGMSLAIAAIDWLGIGLAFVVVAGVAEALVAAVLTMCVWDEYVGADSRRRHQIHRAIGGRIWALIAAWSIATAGFLLGLVLLVVPGLILMAWWGLQQPVIIREVKGPVECLGRSRSLMRGHTLAGVWIWLVALSPSIAATVVVLVIEGDPDPDRIGVTAAAIEFVIGTFALPIVALTAAAMYDLLAPYAPSFASAAPESPAT